MWPSFSGIVFIKECNHKSSLTYNSLVLMLVGSLALGQLFLLWVVAPEVFLQSRALAAAPVSPGIFGIALCTIVMFISWTRKGNRIIEKEELPRRKWEAYTKVSFALPRPLFNPTSYVLFSNRLCELPSTATLTFRLCHPTTSSFMNDWRGLSFFL